MKFLPLFLLILFSNLLLAQEGSLDVSFGYDGRMLTHFEGVSAEANSMALQSDGKIIVSGTGDRESDEDIVAARYLPNGQLDTEFAQDGRLVLSISDFRDRCYDIAVDDNDNIYLTGFTATVDFQFKGFVVKLNKNGDLDSTFAQHGIWVSELPGSSEDFREILLQSDGKILIAGEARLNGGPSNSILVRMHSDGTLDADFGDNGIAYSSVPDAYNPRFAILNSNEEIITGGFLLDFITDIILIKFNPQGEIDSSFGVNGIMIDDTSFDEYAYSLAIQEDDKIIVTTGISYSGRDFGMVRYNRDGTLDDSFGMNGRVATDFSQKSNTAHSIVLQEDGKIILSGFLGITPNHDYAIARYDTLGNLDPTFGNGGRVVTDFELDDLIYTSALQADAKLLCAGNSKTTDGNSSFSIARYLTQTTTNTLDLVSDLNEIKAFPNPSKGNFTLSFESDISTMASIQLYNSSGTLLEGSADNIRLVNGLNTINMDVRSNFGDGLYIINIKTEKGSNYKRLVIVK